MIIIAGFGTCQICKKHKSQGNHRKCSRILQKRRDDAEHRKILEAQRLEEELTDVRRKATLYMGK